MFAISFDMSISELEANYGTPYNRAYFEIKYFKDNMVIIWKNNIFVVTIKRMLGKVAQRLPVSL
jgi:virulence-associated protein VapD